jgi:hypothetical protein
MELTPDLEQAIAEEADRLGTTPEMPVLDSLRRRFLSTRKPRTSISEGTLAEFLGDFIGTLRSSDLVPGGARMSEATGREFVAEGMNTDDR